MENSRIPKLSLCVNSHEVHLCLGVQNSNAATFETGF